MAAPRALTFFIVGLLVTGCSPLKPEYTYVKTPPPIRILPDGTRIDNRGYHMDAAGYRLDRNGQILGMVDYDTQTDSSVSSNAVAGYYISSQGTVATGTVAVPSEGARSGAGYGPGSAQPTASPEYAPITPGTSNVPRGSMSPDSPMGAPVPAPSTAPIPVAPPATR
jgi:hypothetical protein